MRRLIATLCLTVVGTFATACGVHTFDDSAQEAEAALDANPNVSTVPQQSLQRPYAIEAPRVEGFLRRPDGHEIHYEVSGNPNGKSIVFVHGGPGSYADPEDRGWFDPKAYNIVLFDQRGCGQSRPSAGSLDTPPSAFEHMTIDTHIADMEALRAELGIKSWVVFGGSWGSTLSTAYAEAHPDRVLGLVLRGIYLGTHEEHEAIYGGDMPTRIPEAWNILSNQRKDKSKSMLESYRDLVFARDLNATGIWSLYEEYVTNPASRDETLGRMRQLEQGPRLTALDDVLDSGRLATAIMQVTLFPDLEARQRLLDPVKLAKLRAPVFVVQGAMDEICPPRFADSLVDLMKKSGVKVDYKKVPGAGHSAYHEQMTHWLLKATDALR